MNRLDIVTAPGMLAGLLIVGGAAAQSTVTLPDAANALSDRPRDVYSLGKVEGEKWELLSNVSGVAFDRNDNLFVLDMGNARVLVFGRDGRFVREFGGQGQGPGEFTLPTALAVLVDGTIAVADFGRFHVFHADGTLVRTIVSGEGSVSMGGGNLHASQRGGVVLLPNPALRVTPRVDLSETRRTGRVLHHPLTAGSSPVQLHEFVLPESGTLSQTSRDGRSASIVRTGPPEFTPGFSFGVLPGGGLAISNSVEYRIEITDASGVAVRTIRRSDRPRQVTRADQDAARERTRRTLSGSGSGTRINVSIGAGSPRVTTGGSGPIMPPDQIEERLRAMQFAGLMPLVNAIRTDPTGRIWVERTPARGGDYGPIDLIMEDGRYIGTITGVRTPSAVNPTGTLGAWIERDELDVEHVVVRQLPATWK